METKKRTGAQNRSLHSTLGAYAEALNSAGYDYSIFLEAAHKRGFKAAWTPANVKELYNVVAAAMYAGKSSSELTTVEMSAVYDVFERHLAQQSGISMPWHSNEPPLLSVDNQWWGE